LSILFFSLIIGDSYSYDEYSYCDRQARTARVLDLVPTNCEMSTYGFCYEKGQDYPDKAIRRFLKENLGLMKRMTSDLDSREVVREMRSGFNHWTDPESVMEDVEEELEEMVEEMVEEVRKDKAPAFKIDMMPPGENIFNGLKYNFKYGSGLAMIKNAKDNDMEEVEGVEEEVVVEEEEEDLSTTTTTKTTTSQTTMIVTTLQSSSSERPATTVTREEYIEPSTVTEQMVTTTLQDNIEPDSTLPMVQNSLPPTEQPLADYLVETEDFPSTDYDTFLPQQDLLVATTENIQPDSTTDQLEAQMFDYSGESVNACEVEESVTAPYWANNTRNHTLALLNLYPFEQYIHMEICRAEYDEMLCRPGCRCEQQYRLQRLLAFDPSNECRGVFSDWFRFPSFCICKCYDSARQLREMGRNPKSQRFSSSQARPGPDTHANSRLGNHRLMAVSGMEDMPAVFPFEGLKMIEDEQNRLARRMEKPLAVETQRHHRVEEVLMDKIAVEHMDNTVESDQVHYKKTNKEARLLDENFFYNQPIVDFKLSDGTMGSVEQVPRK